MPLFDKKDKSRYATFTRRSVGMGGGMAAIFAVLGGRLYQLQVREGEEYRVAAEDNRVSERLIAPPRGRIIDRFGVELANNRRNYRVLIVAEQASEGVDKALDTISKVILITPQQRRKVLRDIAANKKFVPVPVAENLTWEEFSRVNLHLPYLPGVQPDVGESRDYPFGKEMVHVLGYVAAVSPKEQEEDKDPLMSMPGMRIGKRGVEKEYDTLVRGSAGASRVEVNAFGRIIRELGKNAGVMGEDVYLTLDRQVQQKVAETLGEESAACVVMDVHNGDVIALASTPGFDPNWFNVGLTGAQWRDLTTDDHKPLLNKVMGGTYPPGSTFKPAVALAAVEAGIATPDFRVTCTGVYNFGGNAFHCWKKGGHGTLDVQGALQHSCNVFFAETARRLGIDRIEEMARRLGLGEATGIELPGERTGLIPSREWKQKTYKWGWQQGDTISVGIGQGYVTVTPLQLCTMIARIAGGKAVSPRLVHSVGDRRFARPQAPSLGLSEDVLASVRQGLNMVCNVPGGTAYSWRITQPGFEMAGKTGTAQVRRFSREERARGLTRNENLEWKMRDHALYVAYAPVNDPKYAIVTLIEHGAVPAHPNVSFARDILLFCQQRDPSRLPTAYPVTAAEIAPATPSRQSAVQPVPAKEGG
ncbi:MAG TPA: penicillin-binding protein 2 [Rhizomicrobium sp.]|jgi:penicillin-binding protein 2|nr:penicillin-binding protein 2 [Rhizomicrobium sp.]